MSLIQLNIHLKTNVVDELSRKVGPLNNPYFFTLRGQKLRQIQAQAGAAIYQSREQKSEEEAFVIMEP